MVPHSQPRAQPVVYLHTTKQCLLSCLFSLPPVEANVVALTVEARTSLLDTRSYLS